MKRMPRSRTISIRPMSVRTSDRVLQAEENRRPVRGAGALDVGAVARQKDEVLVVAEACAPIDEVAHRLAETFMVADSGVNRGQAALAHLLKDLARPVAVLKPVNEHLGLIGSHSGTPAWI